MKYCKNCGEAIDEDSKYCSKCGALVEDSNDNNKENHSEIDDSNYSYDDEEDDDYDEEDADYDDYNHEKRKIKGIILGLIVFIIVGCGGAALYCNFDKLFASDDKNSISLVSLDVTKYPNVEVVIKCEGTEPIKSDDLTIKENETFQKDIKVQEDKDKGNYNITYECSENNAKDTRNIKLSYVKGGKESVIETSYSVPKDSKSDSNNKSSNNSKNKDKSTSAASDKSVNSYDSNYPLVKSAINEYEKAYIKMVNTKDTYYIRDAIDLGYGLLDEFTKNVASYKEQDITESLESSKVEQIEKVNDDEYDVTVYEKYHIYYGKKHENKNLEFRTVYTVDKVDSVFKVKEIKSNTKITV